MPSCENKHQVLADPDDLIVWQLTFNVDLTQTKEDGKPSLVLIFIAPVVEPAPTSD